MELSRPYSLRELPALEHLLALCCEAVRDGEQQLLRQRLRAVVDPSRLRIQKGLDVLR